MKFFADECCDAATVDMLRDEGYDVCYAIEVMRGATDEEILKRAYDEQRVLLTEDKDFGELVYRLQYPAYAILLLRFDPIKQRLKRQRLVEVLQQHGDDLTGHFVVIEMHRTRMRPLTISQ
jgi:predicted nuclease of predicted toxin-antitoxin system